MSNQNTAPSFTARLSSFTKRNIIIVVMVPTLVGLHWGWLKLQNVEAFVTKEEKESLPFKKVFERTKSISTQGSTK